MQTSWHWNKWCSSMQMVLDLFVYLGLEYVLQLGGAQKRLIKKTNHQNRSSRGRDMTDWILVSCVDQAAKTLDPCFSHSCFHKPSGWGPQRPWYNSTAVLVFCKNAHPTYDMSKYPNVRTLYKTWIKSVQWFANSFQPIYMWWVEGNIHTACVVLIRCVAGNQIPQKSREKIIPSHTFHLCNDLFIFSWIHDKYKIFLCSNL